MDYIDGVFFLYLFILGRTFISKNYTPEQTKMGNIFLTLSFNCFNHRF